MFSFIKSFFFKKESVTTPVKKRRSDYHLINYHKYRSEYNQNLQLLASKELELRLNHIKEFGIISDRSHDAFHSDLNRIIENNESSRCKKCHQVPIKYNHIYGDLDKHMWSKFKTCCESLCSNCSDKCYVVCSWCNSFIHYTVYINSDFEYENKINKQKIIGYRKDNWFRNINVWEDVTDDKIMNQRLDEMKSIMGMYGLDSTIDDIMNLKMKRRDKIKKSGKPGKRLDDKHSRYAFKFQYVTNPKLIHKLNKKKDDSEYDSKLNHLDYFHYNYIKYYAHLDFEHVLDFVISKCIAPNIETGRLCYLDTELKEMDEFRKYHISYLLLSQSSFVPEDDLNTLLDIRKIIENNKDYKLSDWES